jgi:hypothetical protein
MAPKRRLGEDGSSTATANTDTNASSTGGAAGGAVDGTVNTGGVVKAVIIMGGPSRGTRFRPLSFNVPKPLFPVGGEPLLSHHIDACTKV